MWAGHKSNPVGNRAAKSRVGGSTVRLLSHRVVIYRRSYLVKGGSEKKMDFQRTISPVLGAWLEKLMIPRRYRFYRGEQTCELTSLLC